MIQSLYLKNYGIHSEIQWKNLGRINLVIGENGCGKSFILKSIYTAMKTIEASGRGKDNRTPSQILFDKLYWTFQPNAVGDLVKKSSKGGLECKLTLDEGVFSYSFGDSTVKSISSVENSCAPRESNSIYIPEKEVVSIFNIVRKSREQYSDFGFDDTYLDLVNAISVPTMKGKNYAPFAESRNILKDIIGGSIDYNDGANTWVYTQGKSKFSIGLAAEGVKKIAILDKLLGNRYLDNKSVLIFDEPESGIHPSAITKLMDILCLLAKSGIQIFLATHSYFVLKKLYVLAMKQEFSIPLLSLDKNADSPVCYDLLNGLPENPIINESIRLYEEEVGEVL